MKEKTFGNLIIRHRKSAVLIERKGNLENTKMYKPYTELGTATETLHYKRCELDIEFNLPKEERKEFYEYLLQIGKEAWVNFEPKVADSIGADYDSYWDSEIQDEGNLSFSKKCFLRFSAPFQPVKNGGIVRLYKFNKRKFESFLFDLSKEIITC